MKKNFSEISRTFRDEKKNLTTIDNNLIRISEKKLSLEARALLFYFLSASEGWVFKSSDVLSELATSKDRYYRIVNELRKKGYMLRETYSEGNLRRYRYFFSENSHQDWIEEKINVSGIPLIRVERTKEESGANNPIKIRIAGEISCL